MKRPAHLERVRVLTIFKDYFLFKSQLISEWVRLSTETNSSLAERLIIYTTKPVFNLTQTPLNSRNWCRKNICDDDDDDDVQGI